MPSRDPVTSRRGFFWTGIERVESPYGTVVRGPMYVEWEEPVEVTQPYPIVLIHGGGGQGLDWMQTFDGRPGWAPLLVQRGYKVYVVDRPGHGRSSLHPDVIAPMGAPFPFEAGVGIFRSPTEGPMSHPTAHLHTQWPGTRDDDDPALEAIVVSSGPVPELKVSQELDQSRGAELLDRIGPAVLMAHSLGGPAGWLIADARPDLVKALVEIEAIGPPFAEHPSSG
jgi:pimeloyl-ACP methyl ester carboxylesterase